MRPYVDHLGATFRFARIDTTFVQVVGSSTFSRLRTYGRLDKSRKGASSLLGNSPIAGTILSIHQEH